MDDSSRIISFSDMECMIEQALCDPEFYWFVKELIR